MWQSPGTPSALASGIRECWAVLHSPYSAHLTLEGEVIVGRGDSLRATYRAVGPWTALAVTTHSANPARIASQLDALVATTAVLGGVARTYTTDKPFVLRSPHLLRLLLSGITMAHDCAIALDLFSLLEEKEKATRIKPSDLHRLAKSLQLHDAEAALQAVGWQLVRPGGEDHPRERLSLLEQHLRLLKGEASYHDLEYHDLLEPVGVARIQALPRPQPGSLAVTVGYATPGAQTDRIMDHPEGRIGEGRSGELGEKKKKLGLDGGADLVGFDGSGRMSMSTDAGKKMESGLLPEKNLNLGDERRQDHLSPAVSTHHHHHHHHPWGPEAPLVFWVPPGGLSGARAPIHDVDVVGGGGGYLDRPWRLRGVGAVLREHATLHVGWGGAPARAGRG